MSDTDAKARDGQAVSKRIVGTAGSGPRAVRINLVLNTPAGVSTRVPVILLANFGGGNAPAPARGSTAPAPPPGQPVAAEILARGWGFATLQLPGHPA